MAINLGDLKSGKVRIEDTPTPQNEVKTPEKTTAKTKTTVKKTTTKKEKTTTSKKSNNTNTTTTKKKTYAEQITDSNETPNAEGYTPTNKKYGDYDYHDYLTNKDYQIFKKDGKAYYYNGKNYIDMDMPRMISKEADKQQYEEAVKNGYKPQETYNEKGEQVAPSKTASKVELDTSGLTKKEKKKYTKSLVSQEKAQGKKDTFVRKSGTGIDALTGAYENQIVNKNSVINKNVINPIQNAGRIYESGKLNNKLALEWYNKMEGKKNNVEDVEQEVENFNKFNQDVASGDVGLVGTTIQNLNTQVESIKNQGIAATGGAVVGGGLGLAIGAKSGNPVGGAIKGAKTGAQLGYTFGSTPYMYKLEAGNEYKELRELGVSHKKAQKVARAVGAINAAIESGENIIDILSFEGAGKAASSGVKAAAANQMRDEFGEIIETLGEKEAKNYLTRKYGADITAGIFKAYGKNFLSEAGEEASQELTSILGAEYATKSEGIKRDNSQDLNRIGQSALAGGASALVLGLPTSAIGSVTSYVTNNVDTRLNNIQNNIESNIQAQKVASLNQAERNALVEIAIKNKSGQQLTQQDINTLQFLNQKATQNIKNMNRNNNVNTTNRINEQTTNRTVTNENIQNNNVSENSRIQKFRDSLVRENIQNQESFRNVVEKVIADKDYNVIMDSTIKNQNGQSVDAQISNEDGVTIRINPNSDRAAEILLNHEITHAVGTEEIKNLIVDYASKNPEFNAALEDLKRTYGTNDVSQEVMAEISGQVLGDQNYINSLSVKNPSLFKRIYNAIVSLANKLTGNRDYYWFTKDLKAKWEKAYRESTIQSAQQNLNNEVKYSQNNKIASTDDKGRNLSKGQQQYFKDSVVKDADGNLITVYHSTGEEAIKPFYEFDAKKSDRYLWQDNANFYTDSKQMVKSYFGRTEFQNIDTSKNADTSKKGRWLYEGYLNIKNPYEIDCNGRYYTNAVIKYSSEIEDTFSKMEKYAKELNELANESERRYRENNSSKDTKLRATKEIIKGLDSDRLSDILSDPELVREIDNYKDLYKAAKEYGINDMPSPDTTIEDIYGYWAEELYDYYGEDTVNEIMGLTVEDFVENYKNYISGKEMYKSEASWFSDNYWKIIDKDIDTEVLDDSVWYKISKGMFTDEAKEKSAPLNYQFTTRDIVEYIANENKQKLQNQRYDGIIFKNIIDTAGWDPASALHDIEGNAYKPGNVYVTFDSNQFKAIDNKNPTEAADIRYAQRTGKWREFIEKNFPNYGPKTYLNDKSSQNTITAKSSNGQEITLNQDKSNPAIYNQEIISHDVKDITNTYKNKTVTKGDLELSNFYSNITEKSQFLDVSIRELFKTEEDLKFYLKVTNEEALTEAAKRLGKTAQEQQRAFDEFISKTEQFDAIDGAEGWILLKRFNDAADYDRAYLVARKMKQMGTAAGQYIQSLAIQSRLTPEGMYRWAVGELMEAETRFNKEKGRKQSDIVKYKDSFRLSTEETEFIQNQMEKVQKLKEMNGKGMVTVDVNGKKVNVTVERAINIELARINSMLQNKLPHRKGQSLKAWMRISMLLNPKTQIRNVVGNALIVPVNMVSDVFGSMVDKAVSKKTGVRTLGAPSLGGIVEYGKGFAQGVKEATQDYRFGIDTKNIDQNRFEIGQGKQFNENHSGPFKNARNKVAKKLNAMNNFLSYIMDAGDRGYYRGSMENSLYNQMKLNNTNEVSDTMADIAINEGLQRTWNDSNEYTQAVLNIRRSISQIANQMNVGVGDYGLGDLMIPFAKTPANLTKAIVDYSPAGFIKAITEGKNLKRAIETGNYTPQMQHDFAQAIGKATAGTLLYGAGVALAKAGFTSGKGDEDKDLKKFSKDTMGIQPYSVNIKLNGKNYSFTYDWAQPVAAPLAITADIEKGMNSDMTITQAIQHFLTSGFNILSQQSFLAGVNEVLNYNDGIFEGIEQQIVNIPATAIPTFFKQIADMFDTTKRITYTKEGQVENMKKTAKSKLPGISKSLSKQVDVLGEDIEKYGGVDWLYPFKVFLSPSNITESKDNDVAKEIYALYEATGDKTIIPRTVEYSTKIDGKMKTLTAKEIEQWQTASGKRVTKEVKSAMKNSTYKSMSNEEKADVINKIVNYSYNKAKSETFNTPISSTYSSAEKAENRGMGIADYYISKVKKNSKK